MDKVREWRVAQRASRFVIEWRKRGTDRNWAHLQEMSFAKREDAERVKDSIEQGTFAL